MLPAEYADKHSSNTADEFEAEKKYVENVKSALQQIHS